MGNTIEDVVQGMYRRFRRTMTPQAALEKLAGDFAVQSDLAARSQQIYAGSLSRDLATVVRRADQLQEAVKAKGNWHSKPGRFWLTGVRDSKRGWVLMSIDRHYDDSFLCECDNAGCAVKHALHRLTKPDVSAVVLHRPGAFDDTVTIYRFTPADEIGALLEGE